MKTESQVLYVYRCSACGHRGDVHLPDDTHEGEPASCTACGASVVLEWDGGVTFEVTLGAPRGPRGSAS